MTRARDKPEALSYFKFSDPRQHASGKPEGRADRDTKAPVRADSAGDRRQA